MFKGKSILITGGTGSLGKALTKYIFEKHSDIKKLVIFSRDEQKQYQMDQEYPVDKYPQIRFFVGDVRDRERLTYGLRGVDYVIHAAAMKHVALAEYNPTECIATNVLGAQNVIAAAIANKVKAVMALSTDKAANPVNLYGATKLVSDKLFVAANNIVGLQDIKFGVVRYGNVCASAGSVVPFYERKIVNGAKQLPVTDIRMTRFWITLQQGVDFVLRNFERMWGGEIFIPKIPSVRIVDLATAMAPHLEQEIVGIRPGEKVHEIMCPADDSHLTFEFADHYVIAPSISFQGAQKNYMTNALGEKANPVDDGFEYNSATNFRFLTPREIRIYNKLAHTGHSFTLSDVEAGKFDPLLAKGASG